MKQPNFKAMSIVQLQELCMSEEADQNIKLLYWLDFFLNDCENNLYEALSGARNDRIKTQLKMELSSTKNLAEVTKMRQRDVQNSTLAYHYRFRTEAERLLPIDLYQQIDNKARATA